jgi:3-dehydroquinate synthase
MAFHTLNIRTSGIDYPIYIGEHTRDHLHEFLQQHKLTGRRVIVTNETIRPLYADALAQQIDASIVTLPDGELYKNLETVSSLYDSFLGLGLDRKSVVIALGGGVIGDTVGFAAATFLRGVPFVQLPTSLLSMVDSSVGGKVGVNIPQGKNLVGAFKQPEMVVIDTALLASLPDVERRCGLAEAIKHGLIADPALLDPTPYLTPTGEFVARAVQVKIDVVQRDPYEENIRAWLNLGHTFGQAIEAVSGYQWRHGEAVAVGLCGAVRLSHLYGLCDAGLIDLVEDLLIKTGLPTRYQEYDPKDIRAAMNSDKKRQNASVRFVLLKGIAQPDVYADVPENLVMQAIEAIRA